MLHTAAPCIATVQSYRSVFQFCQQNVFSLTSAKIDGKFLPSWRTAHQQHSRLKSRISSRNCCMRQKSLTHQESKVAEEIGGFLKWSEGCKKLSEID